MRNSPELTSQIRLPSGRRALKALADHLVQVAPGPEIADERSPAAAQRGVVIALFAAGAFWLALAGLLFHAFR